MIRFLLAAALLTHTAFADDAWPTVPKGKPVITKESGKPVHVVWPSGDEAELKIVRGVPLDVPVPFQVSENSCHDTVGQMFTMYFKLKVDTLIYIWTKHRDLSKVGTPVLLGGQLMQEIQILANGIQFRYPGLAENLGHDRLEPTDLSFIPGLGGAFKPFTVDIWYAEQMRKNPQTGVAENRVSGSVNGVHFNAAGEIESIDDGEEMGLGGDAFLMIGDVVTWIINTPSGVCQISSKPDLGPANQMVGKVVGALVQHNPGPFATYNWESDGHTDLLLGATATALKDEFLEYVDE